MVERTTPVADAISRKLRFLNTRVHNEFDNPVSEWLANRRASLLALGVVIALYAALALSVAASKLPYNDEGWFNLTAQEFLQHGKFATPLVETAHRTWSHIDQRNYMILPGYPMLVAGWFAIVGPGLLASRVFSVLCGALAILALYLIVWKVLGSRPIATVSAALLALDYPFLAVAANARMDISCVALGLCGVAAYLCLRQRRLSLALVVSQALVVASVLNHVNGVVCFAALQISILWFDAGRLRARHFALAAVPGLLACALYFRFVLQDLPEFHAQFGTQASGRFREIWRPTEIWYGFKEGVLDSFGLSAIGTHRAIRFNVAALFAYGLGLLGLLLSPRLRRLPNMRLLLLMASVAAAWLTLHRSSVSQLYVVVLTPFLAVPLATCLVYWNLTRFRRPWLWWPAFGVLLALAVVGAANRVRQNDYRKFDQAVQFLNRSPLRSQGVFASAEFGFPLGRVAPLVDDNLLGFYSGKQAGLIVMDALYNEATTDWAPTGEQDRPAFLAFRERLLRQQFTKAFDNGAYRIFSRK